MEIINETLKREENKVMQTKQGIPLETNPQRYSKYFYFYLYNYN